jgi:hypothetical protein
LIVSLLRKALTHLANGSWWEPVVDPSTIIKVQVDKTTSDIFLLGVASDWNVVPFLLLDQLDYFMHYWRWHFMVLEEVPLG